MKRDPDYKGGSCDPSEAERLLEDQAMLVVVDTQIEDFTIAPQLIPKAGTLCGD